MVIMVPNAGAFLQLPSIESLSLARPLPSLDKHLLWAADSQNVRRKKFDGQVRNSLDGTQKPIQRV